MTCGSRKGSIVIWSSPPMLARTARTVGSANAATRSAARSCGEAFTRRVVGYSTGSRPNSSRNRRIANSWTAGNMPGAANDGDTTATRSPALTLGATVKSGRMSSSNLSAQPRMMAPNTEIRRDRNRRLDYLDQAWEEVAGDLSQALDDEPRWNAGFRIVEPGGQAYAHLLCLGDDRGSDALAQGAQSFAHDFGVHCPGGHGTWGWADPGFRIARSDAREDVIEGAG